MDGPAFGYASGDGFEPHFHNHGGAGGAVIDGISQTTESEYGPGDLVVVVPETSTVSLNSTLYYWLPESHQDAEDQGAPFLGIGVEELDPLDWTGGTVTFALLSITGPGDFVLWQDDGFGGANVFLDSAGDSFTLPAGSHTHFNWGFSEQGIYGLEFEISGIHITDGPQSASDVYTFQVPEPATAILAGVFGMMGMLLRRR